MTASYLVFRVGDSLYAIASEAVRESLSLPQITTLEELPAQVAGVINLRGKLIPVLDLDPQFGRLPRQYRLEDALVIIEAGGTLAGIVAGAVLDLVELPEGGIEAPPFAATAGVSWPGLVTGVARMGGDIVMLLDHHRLLRPGEGWAEPETPEGADEEQRGAAHPFFAALDDDSAAIFRRRADLLALGEDGDGQIGLEQVALVALGGEHFAIELGAVREFLTVGEVTPVPNCPDHILGNMNLRGSILTLIDIRALLGLPAGSFSRDAGIVVVADGDIVAGVAVDAILGIMPLRDEALAPLPASLRPLAASYARGTATHDDRPVTVLSIASILTDERLVVQHVQ